MMVLNPVLVMFKVDRLQNPVKHGFAKTRGVL